MPKRIDLRMRFTPSEENKLGVVLKYLEIQGYYNPVDEVRELLVHRFLPIALQASGDQSPAAREAALTCRNALQAYADTITEMYGFTKKERSEDRSERLEPTDFIETDIDKIEAGVSQGEIDRLFG